MVLLTDHVKRVILQLHDVVKHAGQRARSLGQLRVVNLTRASDMLRQVNAAEDACLVRQQRHLATRVSRMDFLRVQAALVHGVHKEHAGLAVAPCPLHNVMPQPSVHAINASHEVVGQRHGDVEVRDVSLLLLAGNEVLNVRVLDIHNRHVRSRAKPCLRDALEPR